MTGLYGDAECGGTNDGDFLWQRAHACYKNPTPRTSDCPAEEIDPSTPPQWVVMNGGDHTGTSNTQDFLLVPTDRIKGIECPKIWQHNAPDYWSPAWQSAQKHVNPTQGLHRALGISSIHGRRQEQLHIHMAGLRPEVLKDLEDNDQTILSVTPTAWKKSSGLKIHGWDEKAKNGNHYFYRVIHRADLKGLFEFLYNHVAVVSPTEAMADQILIVAPRQKSGGGFYILNSWGGLQGGGTSTCDYLLRYHG